MEPGHGCLRGPDPADFQPVCGLQHDEHFIPRASGTAQLPRGPDAQVDRALLLLEGATARERRRRTQHSVPAPARRGVPDGARAAATRRRPHERRPSTAPQGRRAPGAPTDPRRGDPPSTGAPRVDTRQPLGMAVFGPDSGAGRLLRRSARLARAAREASRDHRRPVATPGSWDPTQTSALYAWCRRNGLDTRPQYLWPLLHGAHAAKALGIPKIAALEFGVAGGNGLIALERAAETARNLSGTEVEIFGFDTGTGMPPTADPRDAPWLIEPSYSAMDEGALRKRLTSAELVLGPVAETIPEWSNSEHPPVGFIAFDLDYYSSTVEA